MTFLLSACVGPILKVYQNALARGWRGVRPIAKIGYACGEKSVVGS